MIDWLKSNDVEYEHNNIKRAHDRRRASLETWTCLKTHSTQKIEVSNPNLQPNRIYNPNPTFHEITGR